MARRGSFINNLIPVILLLLMLCTVSAAGADTSVTVRTYDELKTAVLEDGTIVLGDNITLPANLTVKKTVTLDLNGHVLDLGSKTLVDAGNLTVKDSSAKADGKITGTASFKIQVGSSTSTGRLTFKSGSLDASAGYGIRVLANCSLTVDGGTIRANTFTIYDEGNTVINGGQIIATKHPAVQVKGTSPVEMLTVNGGLIEALGDGAAINLHSNCAATINGGTIRALFENGDDGGAGITAFKNTELTVNGGTISAYSHAIAGNGSSSGNNDGSNTKFTVTGGTINTKHGAGVYAPQVNGELTISGGTITSGCCGVETRAGKLTITGGTITVTTDQYEVIPNRNGLTTVGSAVSIRQHTSKQPIDVSISGGTFTGPVPLSQSNPLNYSQDIVSQIVCDISGGVFKSTGTEAVVIDGNYPNGHFIRGGTYTHQVASYVADGYGTKPVNKMYAVYPYRTITVTDDGNGDVSLTAWKTVSDDGATVKYEPDPDNPKTVDGQTVLTLLYKDKVTVTVRPHDDLVLEKISVRAENGAEIPVTVSGNTATFLAPDSDASVYVTFCPVRYIFTVGGDTDWTTGSTSSLNFVVKGSPDDSSTFADFIGIQVDGDTVPAGQYTAVPGSVKLTLPASYLSSLSLGTHTLTVLLKKGQAETSFRISDPAPNPKPVPNTRDSDHPFLWAGLLLLCVIVTAMRYSLRKKKQ